MNQPAHRFRHLSVLVDEVVSCLVTETRAPARATSASYVDATVGGGGHARAILAAAGPGARLLGLDADPAAIAAAGSVLAEFGEAAVLVQSNFQHLLAVARAHGFDPADGVLFDLGVSSYQLETPERGFSFQTDAPLDMRFDPRQTTTAADLVNELPEAQLADLLFRYGEEPASRRIARAIVAARPLRTTRQLAELIARMVRAPGRIHPATRSFQALRIAVNQELEMLEAALEQAVELLRPGGHVAVISFHSLEDRIVKEYFRRESSTCICPPRTPVCICGHRPRLRLITKRPMTAGQVELLANPRSRSAKLRVAERIRRTES